MDSDPGREFVDALAAKDLDRLERALAPDIDFKGMTPGQHWDAHSAKSMIHDVLLQWFEDSDHIEEVLNVEFGEVVDRQRIAYRLRVVNDEGPHEVEQQMYYESSGGRITMARILCSGYRPIPD
jgi:hypothetical protein